MHRALALNTIDGSPFTMTTLINPYQIDKYRTVKQHIQCCRRTPEGGDRAPAPGSYLTLYIVGPGPVFTCLMTT